MKPYFDNINERIIEQLNQAENQILVAVAWITETKIINTLADKARQGIKVEILISAKTFDEKFKEKQDTLSKFLFISKCQIYKVGIEEEQVAPLMHHKFCVVDNHILITGSFNWTRNASRNFEDIIIIDDFEIAQQYADRFKELKQTISKERLWFNQLDFYWQGILKKKISIEHEPTENDLKKIANIIEIDISTAPLSMRKDSEEEHFNDLIASEENLSQEDIAIYKMLTHYDCQAVENLTPLSFLENLRFLNCSGTDIKTLEPIKNLVNLEKLDISYIEETTLNFEHLKNLKNLKSLICGAVQLSNWEAISNLENLEELQFHSMLIKNINTLEPLRYLIKLKHLDISGLQVDDLEPISGLTELEVFGAEHTLITNLSPLYDKKKLKTVDVWESKVSSDEILKLERNNSDYNLRKLQ